MNPPTGFKAGAVFASGVELTWDAVPNVLGYRVYRDGVLVASPSGTSYIDGNLKIGKNYVYTVAAFDGSQLLHSMPIGVPK